MRNPDHPPNALVGRELASPDATLFITVLFLRLLTEHLSYQRVIKDRAVPDEAEAASMSISQSCYTKRMSQVES